MTGGEKKENQIRRSKTIQTIKTKLDEDLNVIKKSSTMKQPGIPEEPAKQQGGEVKASNKDAKILDSLKKQAESVPVLLPAVRIADQEQPADEVAARIEAKAEKAVEKADEQIENKVKAEEKVAAKAEVKAEKKTVQKKKPVRGNALEDAMETLRELHQSLEAEEKSAFTANVARAEIKRTRYESLSASDLKKRAKEAVKRRKNAEKVMEYDAAHSGDEKTYTRIDQAALKKHIASFKKLPSQPYDMATDDKFLANLEKNYQLCDAADHMKHWLDEASDQGFMPEGEDMAALQEKIAVFSEVKQYMDHQKDLMKNPYYQYFAKGDISYTDSQMEHIQKRSGDPILKNYLMNVQAIRSLKFVRSKGMKSAEKFAKEQGKRQAEILGTKQEKRRFIDTLTEKAMRLTGERRFLDKDYDAGFSKERFENALASFKALNLKELHFAGVKDMVEHFDENQLLFDQVHDMEQLMMVAINRGLAPSDQDMMVIRAKMSTLLLAEQMVTYVQKKMIAESDSILSDKTYKDLENDSFANSQKDTEADYRHEPPRFGQDMNRYFQSLLKDLKQEHKDREKKIKLGYGMTHPEQKTNGDTVPGVIPEEELAFRSGDFQKNAFRVEYLRNLEYYFDVFGDKVGAIAAAHAKKTGRPVFSFGRTFLPFVAGKDTREILRVIDTMQVGTDAEKEKLYREIADDAFSYNYTEFDSKEDAVFYRNIAMRARKAKILNNIAGSTGDAKHYIKDAETRARMSAYYTTSCANDFLTAMAQGAQKLGGKGIWYKDFFVENPEMLRELCQDTVNRLEDNEIHGIQIGEESFPMTDLEFNSMNKTYDRIYFMHTVGLSAHDKERAASGIRDRADIILYDELKAEGYHKAVTDEQLEELKDYYRKHEDAYKETGIQLAEETRKKLEKDSGKEIKVSSRHWILTHMNTLAKSTYGKKQEAGKKEEEKKENRFTEEELERSVSLYKGLFLYNSKTATAEERGACARAIEEMFGTIMSFDLSRLNFRSYSDLIKVKADDPNRFTECLAVTRLAMEAVNFISRYRQLREDEEVSCRLNAVHVDEVKARIDLLMSAEALFDGRFLTECLESPELKASGYSLDAVLHLSEEQIQGKLADALKTGEKSKIDFWTNVMSTTEALKGFDIGIPATVVEEYFRMKNGLKEKSRATETRNILKGESRVLDDTKEGEIRLSLGSDAQFAARFSRVAKKKDYSISKRESNLYNKKSRLFRKREFAETLQKQRDDVANDAVKARTGITLANWVALGEEVLADLSAFMKADAAQDNLLAERYADQEKRYELMDEFTREIMELNLSIQAETDEQFAASSGYLEMISRKAVAYDRLLKANPDYLDRLRNRRIGSRKADLEKVEEKRDSMLAISDYYRARRLLLTDHYFILHYDDELSAGHDEKQSEDQRRIAELLRLVSVCQKRLTARDFRARENTNLDTVLSRAEMINRQQAYLTGRPDLTKADPAKAYQTNKDIVKYLKAAELDEVGGNIAREELCKDDVKKSFPQAEKYRTEGVGNYIDGVRAYAGLNDRNTYTPQQRRLFDALKERTKNAKGQEITSVRFHDPVTGETWNISTNVQRLIIELVMQYGVGMPEEEVLETIDGLLLCQKENLDLSDEKTRLYARERWLDSMQKLFYMEYNAMKQFENTYGTLMDEMPAGCFFASIGSGLKSFAVKNRFGQDVAQMCDKDAEKNCLSDGEKMTAAQLLAKHGRIPQDVAEDCYQKNCEYYQTQQACINNFIISPANYASGDFRSENDFETGELLKSQYTKDHVSVSGPKMSMAESRKLWKEARKYEDDRVLTGGPNYLQFQKDKLDLYTQEEKKELKKDRAKDLGLMHFYQFELDERREKLLLEARDALGAGISDELLKELIEFHPGMLKEKTDNKQTEEFYDTVKKFAGIGIPKDQQDQAKKEAAGKLFDHWDKTFAYGCTASSVQTLMGYSNLSGRERTGQARTNEDVVLEGSKLYIGEARHRMYESVLRLFASDEDAATLIAKDKQKNLRDRMREQLKQETFRALIQNKDYLELKDIGSQRKSYPEKMFQELDRFRVMLRQERRDLVTEILGPDEREVLKYFGIPCPAEVKLEKKEENAEEKKAEPEVKAEEKKAEPKVKVEEKKAEPKVVAEEKKEEKKEEKIGDNLAAEIEKQKKLHYEMPAIDYKKSVQAPEQGEHVPYESQGQSTYCWACVMSGLMNAKAGKKVSDLSELRKRPIAVPAYEESGIEKKENYDAGVNLVNGMYNGTVYGNPAIFGDYIFDKLPDTAVRTAIISREPERLEYCKRRFLETLSKNLEKGPVGFLHGGHFVLVRGLEGDRLLVNDSMSDTPDKLVDYNRSVSELFASSGEQLELVWLEDIQGQEEKLAEEFNLNYSAEKKEFALKQDGRVVAAGQGEVSYDQPKNEQTILHRNGVEATAQYYDDVVFSSVYVPKKLAEKAAKKAKSVDDIAEGLIQGVLGDALKELEQEEAEEEKQEVKAEKKEEKKEEQKDEKKEQAKSLPATPAEYYAEVKRIVSEGKDKLFDGLARVSAMAPSNYLAVGSQESRYLSRQISMLTYFGKLDEASMNEAFYALMVKTDVATVRQKTLKAREYERLFEQILDFDIRKFNIKSIPAAFSPECMDAAVMASALFDCHPSMMRDYESLLADPAVRTSLSENEFKEIKARWEMIHSGFSWVSDAAKFDEIIRKNGIDIDAVLSMSMEQLMEMVTKTSDSKTGDPKLNEFYVWVVTQKTMWAQEGYEGPGGDVEELLQKKRSSDRYQLPKDQSYAEDAKKKIRARLAEDEGKIFDRNIETALEPTLEKQLKKVEEQFKGTGVSKSALSDMKKTTKAVFQICEEQNNAVSKSTLDALKETSKGTIDIRGIAPLLRPVKLNKDNQPATEEDMRNRKLNEKDVKNLSTNRLSDRVEFLERVVGEARDIMFTVEELKDHKVILKNRERAIKHMRLMHNLLNLYTYHENYFLNQAPAETRDFMFMLASASEYVNFQAYHIQNALQEKGLGAVPLGGSSSLLYTLQYDGFFDYKTVVSVNKKLSKLGPTAAQFYYGNIIGLKPIIDTEDPDELDIPAMLEDARLEAIEDAKKRKITDSVLSSASRMILAGELPKGTETYDDKDNERIMAKYLDLFASKNKTKLKNKSADRKKLKTYIDEYKSKNKVANQEGLIDE